MGERDSQDDKASTRRETTRGAAMASGYQAQLSAEVQSDDCRLPVRDYTLANNYLGEQVSDLADRPIGILGGMGPEATVLLQRKLIEAIPARDDSDHIPLLIDMNPQVPSRIAHLIEGRGEDPGPTLAGMARRLEAAGATALAMPCNTAHHYAGFITEAVSIPLLNIVEIASDHALAKLGANGCVGILASPAVRRTGLFDEALMRRGLSAVWPGDEDPLLAAIRDIKGNGPSTFARETLKEASRGLAEKGAGFQLIACSEFSLIADSVAEGVTGVDTLDLLTDAIVRFYNGTTG